KKWGELDIWHLIYRNIPKVTASFYAAAIDKTFTAQGELVDQPEYRQIYVLLFERTLWISILITVICLILGYPVAFLLASLPVRFSNLLMIMVLLPFWTSLLVRTTSWIVLLQKEGVVNSILVWAGIINDDGRLQMIFNQTGTVVAMVHILLPFTILPMYSVMKTIPPSYMRAARSMGANGFTAFRRVYFPLTLSGLGAGGLLVFILAVGYYITPALVGGSSGQLISNVIAYHMTSSLNWGLAAALGTILLFAVLVLFWFYNRLVGIDKMKFG
ncbi:MAG: ABC transporter permease, partial [Pseudomonadota bacterium]